MIFLIGGLLLAAFVGLEYMSFHTAKLKVDTKAQQQKQLTDLQNWVAELRQNPTINISLLVARHGKVIAEHQVGYADIAQQRPITPRTSFNLASVSKHFTAFAVLMLAHEGKLSLNDPLTRHLPELNYPETLRLKHLLSHTSGIPDYAYLRKKALNGTPYMTTEKLLDWLNRDNDGLTFPSGSKDAYSNSNYVLLAEVIRRLSGQSYADFMQQRIFTPLKMHDTAVVNQLINTNVLTERAYGQRPQYLYFGQPRLFDLNHLDGIAGDGNIYSTPQDLLKWDQALRDGRLLPLEAYQPLYEISRLDNGDIIQDSHLGEELNYGFGVTWRKDNTDKAYSYGSWQGFHNSMMRDLNSGITVIMLSNSGPMLRTFAMADKVEKWADSLGGN